MKEIKELLRFMRTGKRKEILFASYISIMKKKQLWSMEVETKLYRQIRESNILNFGYKETLEGPKRVIYLLEPNHTNK